MAELTDPWAERAYLRDVQYKTDVNLAARQSIYAYQQPPIDLPARVIDLAAPAAGATVVDVGCGNGAYLAELARRGSVGRVLGLDLSPGMLAAALSAMAIARALPFGTVIALGPVTGLAAGLVMVLTIWIPSPWLAGLCFFLIGAGPMLWIISTTTLRQAVTPSHALGRVSAIMMTAALRLPLSLASDCADESTCAAAEPVAVAPLLTSPMLLATCDVPCAACPTLRTISCMAAFCCSTAPAIAPAIDWTWPMVEPVSLMTRTKSAVVAWMAAICCETSSVAYRPDHRWYYFPEMQPDEAVLIRVHDSATDGRARLSFHTSFENPLAVGAPPRESIEVRSLVSFPPGA